MKKISVSPSCLDYFTTIHNHITGREFWLCINVYTHLGEWMIGLGMEAWKKWPIAPGNTDK